MKINKILKNLGGEITSVFLPSYSEQKRIRNCLSIHQHLPSWAVPVTAGSAIYPGLKKSTLMN